jgi:hypothetical protein
MASGAEGLPGPSLAGAFAIDDLPPKRPSKQCGRLLFKATLIEIDDGIPTVVLEELTQAGSEDLPLPMVALTVAERFF